MAVVGGHNGVHYYSAVASAESADMAVAVAVVVVVAATVVAVAVVVVVAVVEAAAVAGCQYFGPGNLLGSGTAFRCPALAVDTSPRTACIVLASVWVREQVPAVSAFY